MEMNRREFMVLPAAAMATSVFGAVSDDPWQRKIRRLGQLNMTEHDPVTLNVEQWADYWASMKVDAVLVSVTGILAYYQTKVPFHRKGRYLGDRDFFGDCCSAAKKRGLHVIARLSPDLNWEDALDAHPEWFEQDAEGNPSRPQRGLAGSSAPACSRRYMTDYIPAIMREINSLYDVDGLFTNAWPPLGTLPVCHCAICRKLPPSGTIEYWDKFNERTVFLWKLYDSIAKEKRAGNFYFANLGGGIRCSANLVELGELCEWFQADNQGRGGEDAPIWGCAMQGRVCHAVQKGKMATNVTAGMVNGAGPLAGRCQVGAPNARMWMDETVASGMVPYHHIVGAENGLGEDRRSLAPAREFFNWTAKHDPHFINKRSIAVDRRGHGTAHAVVLPSLPMGLRQGSIWRACTMRCSRGDSCSTSYTKKSFALDDLQKYSALLLPNIALLSDSQLRQLREYVEAGGSLLATFETGLYTERNQKRADFGLADAFGIRKAGEIIGTNGNAFSARIEKQHAILEGLTGTNWIAGAEYRVPIAPVEDPILTVVPGSVAYPPELSYPDPSHTTRARGGSSRKGQKPPGVFPWRHRPDPVALRAHRSQPLAAEFHSVGGGSGPAGRHHR